MRKKYCTLQKKAVYAKVCIDCGGLTQTKTPIKKIGTVFQPTKPGEYVMIEDNGQPRRLEGGAGALIVGMEFETPGWECPHLFERVVFKGPHTDKWRKRLGHPPEPPPRTMERYQYSQNEIGAYS